MDNQWLALVPKGLRSWPERHTKTFSSGNVCAYTKSKALTSTWKGLMTCSWENWARCVGAPYHPCAGSWVAHFGSGRDQQFPPPEDMNLLSFIQWALSIFPMLRAFSNAWRCRETLGNRDFSLAPATLRSFAKFPVPPTCCRHAHCTAPHRLPLNGKQWKLVCTQLCTALHCAN